MVVIRILKASEQGRAPPCIIKLPPWMRHNDVESFGIAMEDSSMMPASSGPWSSGLGLCYQHLSSFMSYEFRLSSFINHGSLDDQLLVYTPVPLPWSRGSTIHGVLLVSKWGDFQPNQVSDCQRVSRQVQNGHEQTFAQIESRA